MVSAYSWSPDGINIVFASVRALDGSDASNPNETTNIWVVKVDGTNATPLTRYTGCGTFGFAGNPVWSPDGKRVAFESDGALDGTNVCMQKDNVWLIDVDGTEATPLTRLTSAVSGVSSWSPDGAKLVFVSDRNLDGSDSPGATFNIWIMGADGSAVTPLTKLTDGLAGSMLPVWRP